MRIVSAAVFITLILGRGSAASASEGVPTQAKQRARALLSAKLDLKTLRRLSPTTEAVYRQARWKALRTVIPHTIVTLCSTLAFAAMDKPLGRWIAGLTAAAAVGSAASLYRSEIGFETIEAAIHDPLARPAITKPAGIWMNGELQTKVNALRRLPVTHADRIAKLERTQTLLAESMD